MICARTISILLLLLYSMIACNGRQSSQAPAARGLPKSRPQPLEYQNVSILLQDMDLFSKSVRKLEKANVQKINDLYRGVVFEMKKAPLLYNVYADPAGGRVVFVVFPKDPRTGSNYLLTFDKSLPVVNTDTIEIQIRTKDPEQPLNCLMQAPDPETYMKDYRSQNYEAQFTFTKQFLQSGTFDFDALTVPSYRMHGHPFIVFDLVKMKLIDTTANLSTECRQ